MDQGVIRSLKAHYRGRIVRFLCRALEKKEPCPKISILQSMKILADSWKVVTKETIINCFRKAGITPAIQQAANADSDVPFKDLQESLNDLRKASSSMMPGDVTATALVSLDDNFIAAAPEVSEGDIIEELRDRQEQGEEEENDDEISIEEIFDPVVEKPSRSVIGSALDDLKDAAIFSDEGVQMKRLILSFERLHENERLKCLKQRDIFFSIWVFFYEHSRITGLQRKGEDISLTPHYHSHPLHRQLDIARAITAESSPLHIVSSRTRTGNRFPSASR